MENLATVPCPLGFVQIYITEFYSRKKYFNITHGIYCTNAFVFKVVVLCEIPQQDYVFATLIIPF
jgi:hypothetical protein